MTWVDDQGKESDEIEKSARRLCIKDGKDPDEPTFFFLGTDTYPLWNDYIDEAVYTIAKGRRWGVAEAPK